MNIENINLIEASGYNDYLYIKGLISSSNDYVISVNAEDCACKLEKIEKIGAITWEFELQLLNSKIDIFNINLLFSTDKGKYPISVRLLIDNSNLLANKKIKTLKYFEKYLSQIDSPQVLDVGGRARSGNIYNLNKNSQITTIDIVDSPDVNIVCDAHEMSLKLKENFYDAIQSFSAFEHLAMPWKVAIEMNKVLKVNGLVKIVTHQSIGMHDQPCDYFRFSDTAWNCIFNEYTGFEIIYAEMTNPVRIIPKIWAKWYEARDPSEGFRHSIVLARKIHDCSISWPVPLNQIISSKYPN